MKILLTGVSGFIGGHLLSSLVETFGQESVVALTSKKLSYVDCVVYKSVDHFGLDKNKFDDITNIIHAGAFTPKDSQQANCINLCNGNIEYTKELLSFSYSSLVKFINISSSDVYRNKDAPISEESEIKPISLYGYSKLYCEEMVKYFGRQKNIEFINLRLGHVYGPGEEKYKKVLPVTVQNILEGKPLELWGDGSDLRSFIFIKDVVRSIVNALTSDVKNIDINVVSGSPVSIKDILDKVIEISGKKVEINQRVSNHQKRDLVFDNKVLLNTVLEKETDLIIGLKAEYEYMKYKYENNI
jgi:UDP-glucose 4-epimerase